MPSCGATRFRVTMALFAMAANPVDPTPFVLAGEVSAWYPETRVLYLGRLRLDVAAGVDVQGLVPTQSVTVTGYRSKHEIGPWVVTSIRVSSSDL